MVNRRYALSPFTIDYLLFTALLPYPHVIERESAERLARIAFVPAIKIMEVGFSFGDDVGERWMGGLRAAERRGVTSVAVQRGAHIFRRDLFPVDSPGRRVVSPVNERLNQVSLSVIERVECPLVNLRQVFAGVVEILVETFPVLLRRDAGEGWRVRCPEHGLRRDDGRDDPVIKIEVKND